MTIKFILIRMNTKLQKIHEPDKFKLNILKGFKKISNLCHNYMKFNHNLTSGLALIASQTDRQSYITIYYIGMDLMYIN